MDYNILGSILGSPYFEKLPNIPVLYNGTFRINWVRRVYSYKGLPLNTKTHQLHRHRILLRRSFIRPVGFLKGFRT